ncbi:MAG: HIT domain-containing protein [Patescibacteria group bacterium]
MDCVFCKIAKKEIPAEIFFEDEDILGFKTINPAAPVHLLFIPRYHIEWKEDFSDKDLMMLGKLISVAKKFAIKKNIFSACKMIFNIGEIGQIKHIHLHLIGGWEEGEMPQDKT